MKERSVLFSKSLVPSVMNGEKTQTRRTGPYLNKEGMLSTCPYGKVGDILYVREQHYIQGSWVNNGHTKTGKVKWKFVADETSEIYYSNNLPKHIIPFISNTARIYGWYKRLARFMPKSYARTYLSITGVRMERLNDISEEDALSEGIKEVYGVVGANNDGGRHNEIMGYRYYFDGGDQEGYESAYDAFVALWESINGEGSWDLDPFVWVVEFELMERPVNANH